VRAPFGSSPTKVPSLVYCHPYGAPKTMGDPVIVFGVPP
jgi:hypothetical protein